MVEQSPLIGIYNIDNLPADAITNQNVAVTTAFSATSSTTYANVAGASAVGNLSSSNIATGNLTAAGVYKIRGHLQGTAAASGGIKIILNGTATATSLGITTWNYNGTTLNAVTNITALSSALSSNAAAYTDLVIDGTITVNASGTLYLQAAQNTSNATATTITTASYLEFVRIS